MSRWTLSGEVKKALVFPLLVAVASLLAGLYGIVHDQLTYTIAPEYYTKFKFPMFHLADSPLPDRVRAMVVGFLATWWMGVLIGLTVGLAGFMQRDWRRMLVVTLQAYGVVVLVTAGVGLLGLGYGYYQTGTIDRGAYGYWFIPRDVVDLRSYLCVGYMHNASYLGGLIAILAGMAYQVVARVRSR
ncbi:hypothetical protein BH09VER1_BH09VER1_51070 [soil metagenome]